MDAQNIPPSDDTPRQASIDQSVAEEQSTCPARLRIGECPRQVLFVGKDHHCCVL